MSEKAEETQGLLLSDADGAGAAESAASAAEDAILAKLEAVTGEGPPEPAPAAAPEPEPAKEEPEAAEAAEEAPAAEEATTSTPEPEATDAPPPAIAEAHQMLARAQVPKSLIEKMDDVELLSYAHQVDNERRERERLFQASNAGKATTEGAEASGPAEAPDSPSIAEVVSPLAEQLGLDDEGAKVLADTLSKLQSDTAVEQRIAAEAGEAARLGLMDRFPELKDRDSKEFQAVVEAGSRLEAGGAVFKTAAEFFQAGVEAVRAPAVLEEARKARKDLERLRAQGQVTTSTRAAPKKAPTVEERYDSVLELLESDDPQRLEKARGVAGG